MTSSGTEPATFWLVTQCLNQLRHQQRAPRVQGWAFKMKANPDVSSYIGIQRAEGED